MCVRRASRPRAPGRATRRRGGPGAASSRTRRLLPCSPPPPGTGPVPEIEGCSRARLVRLRGAVRARPAREPPAGGETGEGGAGPSAGCGPGARVEGCSRARLGCAARWRPRGAAAPAAGVRDSDGRRATRMAARTRAAPTAAARIAARNRIRRPAPPAGCGLRRSTRPLTAPRAARPVDRRPGPHRPGPSAAAGLRAARPAARRPTGSGPGRTQATAGHGPGRVIRPGSSGRIRAGSRRVESRAESRGGWGEIEGGG